jgi:hypothetical protein
MTVAELIEKLQTLDPNLEVFTPGYEGGYQDIESDFQVCNFRKNVNPEWYYGDHELDAQGDTRGIVL